MPPSAATAACGGTTVGRAKRSLASQAPAGGGCGRSRKGGPRRRQASDREGGVGQASARFGIHSSTACTLGICATPPSATRLLRRHVGLEDGAVRGLLHVGSLGVCVMPGGTHPRVADTQGASRVAVLGWACKSPPPPLRGTRTHCALARTRSSVPLHALTCRVRPRLAPMGSLSARLGLWWRGAICQARMPGPVEGGVGDRQTRGISKRPTPARRAHTVAVCACPSVPSVCCPASVLLYSVA